MRYGSVRYLWTERDFADIAEYIFWVQLAYHASEEQIAFLQYAFGDCPGIQTVDIKTEVELNSGRLVISRKRGFRKISISRVSDDICQVNDCYVNYEAFCDILQDALDSKAHVKAMEEI